jgi:hypothetical protein
MDLKTYTHNDVIYISSFPREFIPLHARYKKGPEYCDKCHVDGCIDDVFVTYCLEHLAQPEQQAQQAQQAQPAQKAQQAQQAEQAQKAQPEEPAEPAQQFYDMVMNYKSNPSLCEEYEIYNCYDLQNYVQYYYGSIIAKPLVMFCEDCDVEVRVVNSSVYLLPLENVRCERCALRVV